jgi:UDP-N-acetylglucosamine 4-epimerase
VAPGLERFLGARRRWLVTGAAGFIGSHLVEELLARGQEVIGLDDFSSGRRENLAAVEGAVGPDNYRSFTLIEGDVGDARLLARVLAGVAVVLHQAARNSASRSIEAPLAAFRVNALAFARLLGVLRGFPGVHLVYASSSSVYGDALHQPRHEAQLAAPLSPYAATKRIDEVLAAVHARSYGLRATGLRYFNVFGPRQDARGAYAAVIPRWIEALRAGRQPLVHGDGSVTRDFTPVANVVHANLLAAARAEPRPGCVYNVGLGRATALGELLAALRAGLAARGVATAWTPACHEAARPGDVHASRADLSLSRAELGYEPLVGLEEGIARTLDAALATPAPV